MSGARAIAIPEDEAEDGDGARGKSKKAPNAFRTISEVADELHIPQHVLRFWETKFPLVKPLKRGGGRRYYRPDDITLLRRISDLLYIQGYTIKGVQRLLREGQIRSPRARGPEEVATLPLGLEELDPELPPEPDFPEEPEPAPAPRRRAASGDEALRAGLGDEPLRAGLGEEALRAVLGDLLDELVDLRELLRRGA
jgi:DNA-binding transcriptional MerR regulator